MSNKDNILNESFLRKFDVKHLLVLLHLKRAKLDYAKSIQINTKLRMEDVREILKFLEEENIIERFHGSSVKRTEAKYKLAHEVRKHHTYYRLSKIGDHILRILRNIEKYFELKTGHKKAFDVLKFLGYAECEHLGTVARYISIKKEEAKNIVNKLISMNVVEECKAKVIKRKHRKAKPKRETRTHHKYYRLSKLGEMLLRYLRYL